MGIGHNPDKGGQSGSKCKSSSRVLWKRWRKINPASNGRWTPANPAAGGLETLSPPIAPAILHTILKGRFLISPPSPSDLNSSHPLRSESRPCPRLNCIGPFFLAFPQWGLRSQALPGQHYSHAADPEYRTGKEYVPLCLEEESWIIYLT